MKTHRIILRTRYTSSTFSAVVKVWEKRAIIPTELLWVGGGPSEHTSLIFPWSFAFSAVLRDSPLLGPEFFDEAFEVVVFLRRPRTLHRRLFHVLPPESTRRPIDQRTRTKADAESFLESSGVGKKIKYTVKNPFKQLQACACTCAQEQT